MKKFVLGLITGIAITGFIGIIFVFALARIGDRKPVISDASTLVLKLEGDIPEQSPVEIQLPFFESQSQSTVEELWRTLRRAAADPKIKAVVLMPRGVGAGWAKLEELHENLLAFKKSGKRLIAFLRNPGTREYYIATAADKIYMTPEDMLDVKGLRAEVMFVKGALEKVGAQIEVEHVGRYKDAGDMFTRTSMTPESRDVLNQIIDQFWGDMVNTVAAARKKSVEDVRLMLEDGPFLAREALAKGLIDSLKFEDEMYGELKDRLKEKEIQRVSHRDYLKSLGSDGKNKIALIVGSGEITRASEGGGLGGNEGLTAGGMIKQLRLVGNDASIKGVILRVDSPGGDGIASDDILHEVKVLSKKKPLVISMSDLAASGGYFIAMSGDPIVAYPNTLTGSIGVLFGRLNLRGLYDKIGINKEIISRGKYAGLDSEYQPLDDATRAKLRGQIEEFYKGFVTRVAEGRRRKYEEMEPLAQGRVWLGSQAKQNGLVDELGGLDKAIEILKKKANIPLNDGVALVTYPPKRSLLEVLMSSRDDSATVEMKIQSTLEKSVLKGFPIRSWTQGGMLKVMPFVVEVK